MLNLKEQKLVLLLASLFANGEPYVYHGDVSEAEKETLKNLRTSIINNLERNNVHIDPNLLP